MPQYIDTMIESEQKYPAILCHPVPKRANVDAAYIYSWFAQTAAVNSTTPWHGALNLLVAL